MYMYMYLRIILEDASSKEVEEVGRGDNGLSGWYLHPFTQDQHVAESEERTGTILVLVEGEERGGRERGEGREGRGRERGGEEGIKYSLLFFPDFVLLLRNERFEGEGEMCCC